MFYITKAVIFYKIVTFSHKNTLFTFLSLIIFPNYLTISFRDSNILNFLAKELELERFKFLLS